MYDYTGLKYLYLVILILFTNALLAQSPDASFIIPTSVCLDENVEITNTSVNGTSYVWDFCFEDLLTDPLVVELGNISGSNLLNSLTLVYDLGNWYGFGTNQGDDKLLRLDFGTSLDNVPNVVDLGDLGILNLPRSLELVNEGSNWYGLLVNINGNSVIRLSFGSNLEDTPVVENLGSFSTLSTPYDLKIVNSGTTYYVLITNFGTDDITVLDFGGSITNTPSIPLDILTIGSSAGLNNPFGIDLIEENGNWYGILAEFGGGKVHRMDFSMGLFNEPVFTEIGTVPLGTEVALALDGSKYVGFVLGRNAGLFRYEFGTSVGNSPTEAVLGDFGFLTDVRSMSIVKQSPEWRGYVGHFTNGKLFKLTFSTDCIDVSENSSTVINPSNIKYNSSGTKLIELTAYSSNGNLDIASQVLTVTTDTAPDVDFTTDNFCLASLSLFTGISTASISAWTWDFGDGSPTETGQIVSHQYTSTGTYTVRLTVNDGTCSNFTAQDITIYNAPVASFTVPAGQVCSNSPVQFTNATTFDGGSPVSWEWDFGDQSPVSID